MIADELNKLKQTKAQIKQALIDKGQNPTDEFASYVGNIAGISGGDPFLELGYPMPESITDAINRGLQFKENWNPNNTSYDFKQEEIYLPTGVDTSNVTYFSNTSYVKVFPNYDLSSYTSEYISLGGCEYAEFNNCGKIKYFSFARPLKKVVFNNPVSIVRTGSSYSNMFFDCYNLKTIVGLDKLDFTNSTSFEKMFQNCEKLEGDLDLTNWNTSNVTTMYQTFYNCKSINKIDISTWDISKTTNMYGMFNNCRNVKEIILPNNFGIACTSMTYMFQYCIALNNIDSIVSKLNLSSTKSVQGLFGYSGVINADLSGLDFSNITSIYGLFDHCDSLETLILPSSIPNVCDITGICSYDKKLKYVKLPEILTMKFPCYTEPFQYCNSLVAADGSISIKNCTSSVFNSFYTSSTRKFVYRDIGYNSAMTSFRYYNSLYWGIETDDPLTNGARQSLIDSLLTYSFDRAAAGYSTCSISLHKPSKELLTEEEIAQITAKGFTIA